MKDKNKNNYKETAKISIEQVTIIPNWAISE